jgi:hypothetical protein
MKDNRGVKVIVEAKDDKGSKVCDYGYIIRRYNADAYEIWLETYQVSLILSKDEFTEIIKPI